MPVAPEPSAEPAAVEPATPEPAAEAPAPAPAPAPEAPKAPTPAFTVKDAGLATPESVLYDDQADVYLVANINGAPGAVDGNGFISKISPEGEVTELKWIDGSKKGSTLNAPKGMAFSGDLLYVADINTVRMFDRKTGKAKGEVKLKGATYAGDVSAWPDGKVYVTDIGVKFSDKGDEPTKSDTFTEIEKKKAKALANTEELAHPNGVDATDQGVWVVTFGSGVLYSVDAKGVRGSFQKLTKGGLDGLVVAGDKVYASSWEASGVYVGTPGGEFTLVYTDLAAPADIGWDSKRSRLLVPQFNDNALVAFDVK
jgi:sugar lactone lactonase YvrE